MCVVLQDLLADTENLASIAVDAAAYYKEHYKDTRYMDSLEAERKNVEKQPANFVKPSRQRTSASRYTRITTASR